MPKPRKRTPEKRSPPAMFLEALMGHPSRIKIVKLLEENPGMNKHQIAIALGRHVNAIEFHMRRLVEAEVITLRPGPGRETLCFRTEDVGLWDKPGTRILFGRGPPRQVASYLTQHPGAESQDIADALGLSIHTVRRHIRTLEESELVQRIRVDRRVIYHAEPELIEWLEEVKGEVGERVK